MQGGLMRSERKHGHSTEQFPASAYIGCSKNLKDLKVESAVRAASVRCRVVPLIRLGREGGRVKSSALRRLRRI